ncbi:energy-coupling factor transporter transmembrane component T family protein [Calorimonas adulescens]|jgi:Cobalt transport protein.|uniref:Energy-coupling factor transporter transmembrane protein EcfT n=1 Tax=Calorimonas adulescens TaxID=2606906 RepID=A0A5D8QE16_9THEO|nr:energy-coupling factor transporter transmembrane protein EcfT [Calorimonas adulescens]TZE82751.1 energy-coupling factor transporter transmembrane protein EcfT [Calorimonas adulescens]
MLRDITIGQYVPGESVIHRLDPRTKILLTLIFIISLFIITRFSGYIIAAAFLFTVIYLSRIPARYIIKGLRGIIIILLITVLINMFMTPGRVLWSFLFLKVTYEGLTQAAFMGLRLVFLIVGTSILTLTTPPIIMTDGIEYLLKPLRPIGVPAHELAMMMTIALRFIPTLMEETDKIMKAQMARGADFESGNVLNRARNMVPLLVPLFINAFRRADELAIAMEARCYRGGEGRTRLHELIYNRNDYLAYVFATVMVGLFIWNRYWVW